MRAFYLLTIAMVVLFATAFAGSTEQRSLRVAGDDDSEERGLPRMESLKAKYQAAKSNAQAGYQVGKSMGKEVLQVVKGKTKEFEMKVDMLKSIKKGESEDTILARYGVKPLFTNEQGHNIYDSSNSFVQTYRKMHAIANKKKA